MQGSLQSFQPKALDPRRDQRHKLLFDYLRRLPAISFFLSVFIMKIKCPACSKVLSIPDSAAGQVVKCPCGKQLRAPNAASAGGGANRPSGASSSKPASSSPAPRPTAGAGGIDPGIFDDLTDNDLHPVKTTSNPYQSSVSGQHASASSGPQELAGIGQRIGGAILDGVLSLLMMLPGIIIGGGMIVGGIATAAQAEANGGVSNEAAAIAGGGILVGVLIIVGNALVPMVVNIVLISKSGQSLGKKIIGTKMVSQHTGETVGFVHGFLLSTFVFQLITGIPVVGGFIALADIIFLFTEGNQTLHDRLAGTRVVRV